MINFCTQSNMFLKYEIYFTAMAVFMVIFGMIVVWQVSITL